LRIEDDDLLRRDFAQRRYNFLIVRFDERTGALQKLLGSARRSEDESETIINVLETIFYGYACHLALIFRPRAIVVNAAGVESTDNPTK
jgi:hypothetical protein